MKQFIVEHWVSIVFGVVYIFTAVVAALPQPGDPRPFSVKAYQCVYDTLHVLLNRAIEKNPNLAPKPTPQPVVPTQP